MAISLTLPVVGSSTDTWGTTINTGLTAIQSTLNGSGTGKVNIEPDLSQGSWKIAGVAVTADASELNRLDGVTTTPAELNVLSGIPSTLTSTEIGYVDGVTGSIQTQMDAKAGLAGAAFTGAVTFADAVDVDAALTTNSLAIDNGSNDFSIEISGGKLLFKFGTTKIADLDSSGNLQVAGNISAFVAAPSLG
jgi:hypothetical protein